MKKVLDVGDVWVQERERKVERAALLHRRTKQSLPDITAALIADTATLLYLPPQPISPILP